MALTASQIAEQKKQVDEILGQVEQLGYAKALFFGRVRGELLFPYPVLPPEQRQTADEAAAKVRAFADARIDHMRIDREARIPDDVVAGLADLGVYRMTIPTEYGGLGFNQQQYLKTMEVLGGHDASVAVFVNAHHSIGCRALVLFGTKEQQSRWLPGLLDGTKLCAFALTEPEAGSDAANVRTTADPTPDGTGYVLNGVKHYITNGGIADVLTVMARTPDGKGGSKVTAFLVSPDMPGFEVLEERAPKCGIRGTATGKLRFTDMRVPAENVLGKVGRGLQAALTVLNYGRVTFGATCTGHAKTCLKAMAAHAKSRKQFGQPLVEFELVKKKVAFAAAHTFAMEAATTQSAAFIDRGAADYMLETAILKVFATEHLWTVVNDTLQVYGGKGYFSDQPVERWMRDARINTIGEGANDVLKAFIAVVGCRAPGEYLQALKDDVLGFRWSLSKIGQGLGVAGRLVAPALAATTPEFPVKSPSLRDEARRLARRVREFGVTLPRVFLRYVRSGEAGFAQAQLVHERIADVAIDLYVSSCVLARLDYLLTQPEPPADPFADPTAGRYFLSLADRRMAAAFAGLSDNDDPATVAAADAALGKL
jgi:alkylation response protein AidB-like acyl-CoA dehydrogenase